MEVKVQERQLEKALKALKLKISKDGLMKELKQRRSYEKPSVKRKRKQAEAQKKRRKAMRGPRREKTGQ